LDERHAWIGDVVSLAGGKYIARRLIPKSNVRVMMTHHVFEEDIANLRALLGALGARRSFMTPADFFSHFERPMPKPLEGQSVLLTFDDGLLSAYQLAQDVLNPIGIKAIFFIPTQILDLTSESEMRAFASKQIHFGLRTPDSFRREEYVTMNARHLQTLHVQGHMILPHTHSHLRLREITTTDMVERELVQPKQIIEGLLNAPANGFASPSGVPRSINPYAYRHICKMYSLCFTALGGANSAGTDPMFIRRESIHPWYSAAHVENALDGVFDPYFAVRAKALRRRAGSKNLRACARTTAREETAVDPAASRRRGKFIDRMVQAFENADIDYALLNEHGVLGIDSDVDIAVDRRSLEVTDAVIRSGSLGRLVQCIHHGVPWSRYYVLEVGEPGRRFRQLDVVCDPWGIGRDGIAVKTALSRAVRVEGIRVPDAAGQALYLGVKRARKRMYASRHHEILRAAFQRDAAGTAGLLERVLGLPGASLAAALQRHESDLVDELEAIRRRTLLQRSSPARLARRLAFSIARIAGRLLRPTGLVVCIVGPDGVGKSSLADALQHESAGLFRRSLRLHSTPGILPRGARIIHRPPPNGRDPHRLAPAGIVGSVARIAYAWLDTFLGWWRLITPARICTSLVLLERGWLDISVDPMRYRVSLPMQIIRGLNRTLPSPDLTLFLCAPVAVIRARKPELEPSEIERQLEAWRLLAARDPSRFVTIDTARSPEATLDQAVDAIADRLASRQRDLRPCSLALRCLGGLRRGGKRYSVISRYSIISGRAEPRWLVPASLGAPGPGSCGLYRPAGAVHAAAALLLDALQRAGLGRLRPQVTIDAAGELCIAIARTLGHQKFDVAAAITGDWRRGERALLSVRVDGRPIAFVKVAQEATKPERERRVLELLGACKLKSLLIPQVLNSFTWEDCKVLVLTPLETRSRANRSFGPCEVSGLAELATLSEALAAAIGSGPGLVPVHGDFAPWNSAPRGKAGLVLWDWECTHLGLPLEDLFYWRLQRLVRFGHGSVASLVASACTPDQTIMALCDHLDVSADLMAPLALRACLERAVSPLGELHHLPGAPMEALTLLQSREF
jgi:peptidoglycan/xylan/chitin deacetylase (PgdA/CDA1 family)